MAATWEWQRRSLQIIQGDKDAGVGQVRVTLDPGQSVQRVITQGAFYGALSIQHQAPGAARIGAIYSFTYNVNVQANGVPNRMIVRRNALSTVQNSTVGQAGGLGTTSVIAWTWPWDWWLVDVQARQRMVNGGEVILNVAWSDTSGDLPNLDQPDMCWGGVMDLYVLASST